VPAGIRWRLDRRDGCVVFFLIVDQAIHVAMIRRVGA
jgi:hypothetical protein